ncbi:helicase-exonuclease AddAB subunit AddB [Salibacterium salarium]|uniref:ATP-dependent helicase/deoxyribonuclease subunit B n=1 Tax=Salibacterium salarium TaxID=284579 RepID=A0A3R9WTQ8_9BACI|nr:helicase-exonuclease AddAB subunit AddB [Salibacterium salarium]RSL33383.1 helicase-exonuclease AddAB subunit AddB [Salibacterium salarium]
MGIRFLLGRTGTGKTHAVRQEMTENLVEHPEETKPIIYLVPDQMTFQAEQDLVARTQTGITRAQVLSFSRMAWKVLQETGGITKTYLQQNGLHMLIRKIIEQEKHQFRLYQKAADKTGFVDHMQRLITEFKRQVVSVEQLQENLAELKAIEEKTAQEQVLFDKLHDISMVWEKVEGILGDRYVGAEDYLHLLAEKVQASDYLDGSDIYVDGFHSFTPQELHVLGELMEKADHITFALTLDKPYDEEPPPILDLFRQPAVTYQKVKALANNSSHEAVDVSVFQQTIKYKNRALRHLENYFEKRPVTSGKADSDVQISAAVNRRTEIEAVARKINKLVQEQGYRYRDIAVMSRNVEDYADMLDTVFRDYDIPIFMDQQRPMLNHPVMECIRSSLESLSIRWRYEPLFRAWKTDMFFSLEENWEEAKESIDHLENYVLAYGVSEKHWKQKQPWTYTSQRTSTDQAGQKNVEDVETERNLNRLREKFATPLLNLEKRFKKAATMKEYSIVLYEFLEGLQIPEKIEKICDDALMRNDLSKAREHEQVWSSIVEMFEQIVEMAGEDKVSFETFRQVVETGLESMTFAIVPPAVDQVTIADMERSRIADVEVSFLLGINEGLLPASFEEEGMLDDEERKWFEKHGTELADDAGTRLLNEQFLIYRAMSLPKEKLYLSYPLADEEGKSLQPSVLINQVKDLFPDVQENLLFNEPQEYSEEEQEDFAGPNRKTLSFLTYQLQRWKQGYPVAPIWWNVYNWYVREGQSRQLSILIKSLFYKNKPVQLSSATSKQLYGETLKASVSRVEQFESCAFSQFVSYGLRLKERDIYKLEAPDIGQLFHAALKDMTEQIKSEGKEWGSLSTKECQTIAKGCVAKIVPTIQREILLSSHRHQYLQKKLEDTVVRASQMLSRQAKASGFSPMGLELGFGPGEQLPPLRFTLSDGTEMEVAGRIDRVDGATGNDGVFVRIIDYKSSEKDIRLADVYFGLALQMLVYLDVVLSFSEDWIGDSVKPAGVLYFHVHNPFIEANQHMKQEDLENEFLKRFKMKGLLMAEEEPVRLMDETLTTGHSQVIPAGMKKDGSFYSNSSVLPVEQFESLRRYIREKLQQDGDMIMQGHTEIQPFKSGQAAACTFCSFKPVCQFDTSFEANDYRILTKDKGAITAGLFSHEKEEES